MNKKVMTIGFALFAFFSYTALMPAAAEKKNTEQTNKTKVKKKGPDTSPRDGGSSVCFESGCRGAKCIACVR